MSSAPPRRGNLPPPIGGSIKCTSAASPTRAPTIAMTAARGWYSQEAALRSSERAWLAFRDAECRYLTQQDVGSRDYAALVRGCLLLQVEERTDELRNAEQVLAAR